MVVVTAISAGGALGDAESDFQSLFGDEVKRVLASRDGSAAAELAAQILKTAGTVDNRPDLDLVFWRKASELGARDPSGFSTAAAALTKLLHAEPAKSAIWTEKLSAIYRRQYLLARGEERIKVGQEQLDAYLVIGDVQFSAGRGREALVTYRKALSLATLTRSTRKPEVLAKIKSANARVTRQREVERLTKLLAKDPGDTKTRTALVRMQLLEFDNPAEAAKLLNDDVDEMLRTYVAMAAEDIDDLEAAPCFELGIWYWETYPTARTMQSKTVVLKRTSLCLQRFLAETEDAGANKLRAKLILKKVDQESEKLGAADKIGRTGLSKAMVLYDFEKPSMTGWKATGKAFGKGPCDGKVTPEYPSSGFAGRGMISSYHGGDPSTGTLTSPKFVIRGKTLTFLIGGGKWGGRGEARMGMDLIVEGKAVRTASGHTSNTLRLAGWDVADLVGKTAQLHMVDTHTGSWGHILIDHVVMHPGTIDTVIKQPTKSKPKSGDRPKSKGKAPYRKTPYKKKPLRY